MFGNDSLVVRVRGTPAYLSCELIYVSHSVRDRFSPIVSLVWSISSSSGTADSSSSSHNSSRFSNNKFISSNIRRRRLTSISSTRNRQEAQADLMRGSEVMTMTLIRR